MIAQGTHTLRRDDAQKALEGTFQIIIDERVVVMDVASNLIARITQALGDFICVISVSGTQALPESIKGLIPPTEELVIMVNVPVTGQVTFTVGVPPTATPDNSIYQTQTALAPTATPEVLDSPTPDAEVTVAGPDMTATLDQYGLLSDFGSSSGLEGGSGLTVLAIAAAGLIAMVFIARRLRTAA